MPLPLTAPPQNKKCQRRRKLITFASVRRGEGAAAFLSGTYAGINPVTGTWVGLVGQWQAPLFKHVTRICAVPFAETCGVTLQARQRDAQWWKVQLSKTDGYCDVNLSFCS